MANIRPQELPAKANIPSSSAIIVDDGTGVWKSTPAQILAGAGNGGAAALKTSTGASVESSLDPALRTDLAASTGGDLVAFNGNRSMRDRVGETIVSIFDFTGTTVARLKAAAIALGIRGGGVLNIPKGNYEADSAELAAAIALPANVTVDGNDSVLTITGTTATSALFSASSVSNVTIRNLSVIGNSVASGYNNGAFANFIQPADATAVMRNIRFENIYLENFKAPWWINVQCLNSTYPIQGVSISGITFQSRAGNAIDPTALNYNAAVVVIQGGNGPLVRNVSVSNVYGDATYIKGGVILYHGVKSATLGNITVLNAGFDSAFSSDVGCYAMQVYDTYGNGDNITVFNVRLSGRSCGVYVAGFRNFTISDFVIDGQTDTAAGTLPKGGIAINGTLRATVRDGRIFNSARGLHWSGPSRAERADGVISNVQCADNVAIPLIIAPRADQPFSGLTISNSRFVATTGRAAEVRIDTSSILNDLTVAGCYFSSAASFGFDSYASSAGGPSGNWVFSDCTLIAATNGVRVREITGRVEFTRCKAPLTGSAQPFQLVGSTDIHLRDCEATAGSSGVAFYLANCAGTINGQMRAIGATTPVVGLGAALPTHSGIKGDYVAAIGFTPPSAGDGQTYVAGWRCMGGTTWRPELATVNT